MLAEKGKDASQTFLYVGRKRKSFVTCWVPLRRKKRKQDWWKDCIIIFVLASRSQQSERIKLHSGSTSGDALDPGRNEPLEGTNTFSLEKAISIADYPNHNAWKGNNLTQKTCLPCTRVLGHPWSVHTGLHRGHAGWGQMLEVGKKEELIDLYAQASSRPRQQGDQLFLDKRSYTVKLARWKY